MIVLFLASSLFCYSYLLIRVVTRIPYDYAYAFNACESAKLLSLGRGCVCLIIRVLLRCDAPCYQPAKYQMGRALERTSIVPVVLTSLFVASRVKYVEVLSEMSLQSKICIMWVKKIDVFRMSLFFKVSVSHKILNYCDYFTLSVTRN